MAAISWASGVSGNWSTKGDWSGKVVPGAGDDVTIAAAGTYTVTIAAAAAAHSLTIDNATATVVDKSALALGGALTLTAGTFQLANTATISGGMLSATGGTFQWKGGTLDGVTYDGVLDMSAAASQILVTSNGLVATGAGGAGAGTINVTGEAAALNFANTQTINNATINLGSDIGSFINQSGAGGTLTLGAALTVDQADTNADIASNTTTGTVVNAGTIEAGVEFGLFTIDPAAFVNQGTIAVSGHDTVAIGAGATAWSNTGTITVTGATLDLDSSFTTAALTGVSDSGGVITIGGEAGGTLNNTGATLAVGKGTTLGALTLGTGGSITGGTIADGGAGMVFDGGALSGVTYDGTINLSGAGANLVIGAGGLIAKGAGGSGAGTINDTGANANLSFQNSQTFNNATINLGNATFYSFLYQADTGGAGGTLTLGPALTINQTGADAAIASLLDQTGDTVVNKGAINATFKAGQFIINPVTFTNQGTITVGSGDTLSVAAPSSFQPIDFTNLAGGVLTGGVYVVDAGSTLNLPMAAAVVTDAASITLSGTGSTIQSLSSANAEVAIDATLTTIAAGGTLALLAQRSWSSTLAMSNAGTLILAGGTFAPASLANTGTLSGNGEVSCALTSSGLIVGLLGKTLTLSGADSLSGTVDGAGTVSVSNAMLSGLTIGGSLVLDDVGTVIQSGTVTVGDATAKAATLEIAAGAIYTIAGDSGVARGHSGSSKIDNSGTLTNSGTGLTVVAVKIVDTGSMVAAVGTLDLTLALTGTGTLAVDAGATLEVDQTAAAGLTATFAGAGATLALKDPAKFAATIAGFASGETIDILAKKATAATLEAGDKLVIVNGKTTVATLQLTGTYTGDTFQVVSDGKGGTNITVTTGAALPPGAIASSHQFIAAMAGLGASVGGAISVMSEARADPLRPMLSAPRMTQIA